MLCALCLTVFTGSAPNIQRSNTSVLAKVFRKTPFYSILIDRNGFMWIAQQWGYIYDGKDISHFKRAYRAWRSTQQHRIEVSGIDKAGFIWAQRYGILYYFQRTETVPLPLTESNVDETW